ncbi:DUF4133 domain-containing protein [Chitinophaga sp. YIM B06452]|uniref:DUF4133 domain-containing protein n=1 Tax=Chitinophaga sp. YIM B06452 TaxID=3082158 RepID=UPI0031FE56B5
MANSVYEINKGINRPLEFRGIRAQYILYLAVGLLALFILFAVMYIVGISVYICLILVGVSGFVLFSWVARLSAKYGEHGLLKAAGFRQVPPAIHCRTRRLFLTLAPIPDNSV